MKWLEYAFNTLALGSLEPVVVLAVVVIVLGFLQHNQAKRALKTIERIALQKKKP